jgi:hypothetical protein
MGEEARTASAFDRHWGNEAECAQLVTKATYHANAREKLLAECCLGDGDVVAMVALARNTGFACVNLRTSGTDNVIGSYPGYNTLYKHIFLQSASFRAEVIQYYRSRGFGWVDILPLNRVDWKVFVWPEQNLHHQAPLLYSTIV